MVATARCYKRMGDDWRMDVTSRQTALFTDGPFNRIRHPIYAGLVFLALGWALFSWSGVALLLAVALAVVLDLKARLEERWLVARHPAYTSYRLRSNRFLPGIY